MFSKASFPMRMRAPGLAGWQGLGAAVIGTVAVVQAAPPEEPLQALLLFLPGYVLVFLAVFGASTVWFAGWLRLGRVLKITARNANKLDLVRQDMKSLYHPKGRRAFLARIAHTKAYTSETWSIQCCLALSLGISVVAGGVTWSSNLDANVWVLPLVSPWFWLCGNTLTAVVAFTMIKRSPAPPSAYDLRATSVLANVGGAIGAGTGGVLVGLGVMICITLGSPWVQSRPWWRSWRLKVQQDKMEDLVTIAGTPTAAGRVRTGSMLGRVNARTLVADSIGLEYLCKFMVGECNVEQVLFLVDVHNLMYRVYWARREAQLEELLASRHTESTGKLSRLTSFLSKSSHNLMANSSKILKSPTMRPRAASGSSTAQGGQRWSTKLSLPGSIAGSRTQTLASGGSKSNPPSPVIVDSEGEKPAPKTSTSVPPELPPILVRTAATITPLDLTVVSKLELSKPQAVAKHGSFARSAPILQGSGSRSGSRRSRKGSMVTAAPPAPSTPSGNSDQGGGVSWRSNRSRRSAKDGTDWRPLALAQYGRATIFSLSAPVWMGKEPNDSTVASVMTEYVVEGAPIPVNISHRLKLNCQQAVVAAQDRADNARQAKLAAARAARKGEEPQVPGVIAGARGGWSHADDDAEELEQISGEAVDPTVFYPIVAALERSLNNDVLPRFVRSDMYKRYLQDAGRDLLA